MNRRRDEELADALGIELPVVQAGMAGGVAGAQLAGAVSAAGALGTVGMSGPRSLAAALHRARRLAGGRPVAANLLVPFLKPAHVAACVEGQAALVVLHGAVSPRWIERLRAAGLPSFATVGTPEQASAALGAGADGLVVQGLQAGGHLIGVEPVEAALAKVLAVAGDAPVMAAGGVADAADVRRLLDAGAAAAVAGTRFLLTAESGAHDLYKRRVLDAQRTLSTLLFGLGWPMRHRVVPNAATERWCRQDGRVAPWLSGAWRLTAPLARATPLESVGALAGAQRSWLPLFSPALPLQGMPAQSVDRCALYAGETALRLHDVVSAAAAVRSLAPS